MPLVGCAAHFDAEACTAVADWLDAHALPSERVAAPEMLAQRFIDRPVAALPEGDDAAALLLALRAYLSDYVVVWPGVAWDGLRAQSWFQEHYRFLDTLPVSDRAALALSIYGYTPSPFDQGEQQPVQQFFGEEGLGLSAVRVSQQRLTPGESLYVTLFWEGDFFALPDAQRLVLRLVDLDGGYLRTQVEDVMVGGFPSSLFREGNDVVSRYALAVPDNLPYGDYTLTVTLYRRNDEPVGGENLRLATLSRLPEVTRERPARNVSGAWLLLDDAVALIGYDAPERVVPGDTVRVTLYWHARAAIPGDYTVFVHLLAADGASAAQDDGKPVWWTYPTTQWSPGQYIRDEHILTLDESTPRGDYTLFVGMYDAETGVRLDVTDAQGVVPDGRIELRVVKVR